MTDSLSLEQRVAAVIRARLSGSAETVDNVAASAASVVIALIAAEIAKDGREFFMSQIESPALSEREAGWNTAMLEAIKWIRKLERRL